MPSVFISRELMPDSIFREALEAAGLKVHGESLLQLDPVPFHNIPEVGWIFFYSKNAVKFYFEGLQNPDFWKGKQFRQGPPRQKKQIKYATYGSATAAYLRKHYQVKVHFVGSAKPKATAEALMVMAAGEAILFPCARHSRHSLYKYIRYKTNAQKLIVYDNYTRKDFTIPDCDILVFTSPMNAEAYFGKYKKEEGQMIIAIGRTTAIALKKMKVSEVFVAKKASEQALADLILGK